MPLYRALVLLFIISAPLSAQRWSDRLHEGQRLRVQTRADGDFEGTFRPPADDSLRLIGARGFNVEPHPIAFAMTNVTKVDLLTGGSPGRRGLKGLLIGFVAGTLIGAAIGNHEECEPYGQNKPGECFSYSGERGLATVLFALTGAGVGSVVGGIVGLSSGREGEETVYVGTAPQPNR